MSEDCGSRLCRLQKTRSGQAMRGSCRWRGRTCHDRSLWIAVARCSKCMEGFYNAAGTSVRGFPLPGERRERPVISVGVPHGEVARWIVGLIHEWVHDGGAERERSLHHGVRISGYDVQRAGAWATWRAALAGAGQQHATALRPIQLTVMDQLRPRSPGIIRSSVKPRPSSQSRNTNAWSLTTLAQMLGCRIPLVRKLIAATEP